MEHVIQSNFAYLKQILHIFQLVHVLIFAKLRKIANYNNDNLVQGHVNNILRWPSGYSKPLLMVRLGLSSRSK